jgi:exosortase
LAAYIAACLALFWRPLWQLLRLSLSQDTYSHILIVPFIVMALILMSRERLSEQARPGVGPAFALALASAFLVIVSWRYGDRLMQGGTLALTVLALLGLIWAGFLLVYGTHVFRSLLFPLLFLLLAVPPPQFLIDHLIHWLQLGSAEVTYMLFRMTGTPVFRQGLVFDVPKFSIEIARECSGIRSAVALMITCLLAGYLFLRSAWARFVLLLAAVPVLVIKNGIRIATLTLLSIYVDPSFLSGNLHREGGFLFFLIGLLILWPVLWWLQTVEAKPRKQSGRPRGNLGGGSRVSPAPLTPHS